MEPRNTLTKGCSILARISLRCLKVLSPFWTTLLRCCDSSPTHNRSGLHSIRDIHGCHLANRFHLEPNDYEVLLVVAGQARYTKFGFAMKPTAWSKFLVLGGHRFASDDCEIEPDIKKINLYAYIDGTPPSQLQRKKIYIVRIGKKTEQSPNKIEEQMGQDGRLIRIKSQSF